MSVKRLSSKQEWQRNNDIAYVYVETRQARNQGGVQISVECTPGESEGSHEALVALHRVLMSVDGADRAFFVALKAFCDGYVKGA